MAAQFAHQLWYAPRDRETAVYIATRYGTRLNAVGEAVPELTPEEILAWSEEQLLLVTERDRPYVVLGQALPLPVDFPQRQPPWPPAGFDPAPTLRPVVAGPAGLDPQMTAFLMANGAIPIPTKDAEGESERDETAVAKEQTTSESTVEPAQVVSEPDPLTPAGPDEPEGLVEEEATAEKALKLARSRYRGRFKSAPASGVSGPASCPEAGAVVYRNYLEKKMNRHYLNCYAWGDTRRPGAAGLCPALQPGASPPAVCPAH